MSISLLRRESGSAILKHRGQYFYTNDALGLVPDLKVFGIKNDSSQDVDSRAGGRSIKIAGTPLGDCTDAQLAVLFPWASFTKGQFTTPVRKVTAVSTVAHTLTIKKHRQITGTGINVISTGTVPGGLTADVTVYVIVIDADTISVAATEANAVADVPVPIVISSAGTGIIKIVQQAALEVNFLDEDQTQLLFPNSALTKMPSLSLAATKTAFVQAEFTVYGRHGMSWKDADSLFIIGTYDEDLPPIDATKIPTVPYTAAFGDAAPFTDLKPRDGVTIDFNVQMEEVMDPEEGVVCHRITGVDATAKLLPLNLTMGDLWGELGLQGNGFSLGQSMPKNDLVLGGPDDTGIGLTLYGSQMQDGSLKIGSSEDRIDEVSFKTSQTWTEGVPNPVFEIVAPS